MNKSILDMLTRINLGCRLEEIYAIIDRGDALQRNPIEFVLEANPLLVQLVKENLNSNKMIKSVKIKQFQTNDGQLENIFSVWLEKEDK